MKVGQLVQIKPNESILDCCAGKRGVIVHRAVGGGWLLSTDHFCPIPRQETELEPISDIERARELLDAEETWVVRRYERQPTLKLEGFAVVDSLAWATLVVRRQETS